MIQEKHLAVVKAALTYFVEEFGPHEDGAFKNYLEAPYEEITNRDLFESLKLFSEVQLRQVMLDTESGRLAVKQHFAPDDCLNRATPAERIKFVALLIPRE